MFDFEVDCCRACAEARYRYSREETACIREDVVVQLEFASTGDKVVDTLTESLPKGKRERVRDLMGVVSNTFLGKREC